MDEPRIVPSVSTAELEEFFVGGTPAVSAETQEQLSEIRDQGSVSTENPLRSEPVFAIQRGRPCVPGEVPPALKRFLDGKTRVLRFRNDATGVADLPRDFGFSEPWGSDVGLQVNGECFFVRTADESLDLGDLFPQVYRRIAACVNFFEGIDTECIEEMNSMATTPRNGSAA